MNAGENSPTLLDQSLILFALKDDLSVELKISFIFIIGFVVLAIIFYFCLTYFTTRSGPSYEIDSAELGYGNQKIVLRPNENDKQIAYSIWVELSTRKIGLEINLENDVVVEVYDSWYSFFDITRSLIKDIPVSKMKNKSTVAIVNLSIEVLNEGLRPHLTKWQARFRHWYSQQMDAKGDISPQEMQSRYPQFAELSADLDKVNKSLIHYREQMYKIVYGEK